MVLTIITNKSKIKLTLNIFNVRKLLYSNYLNETREMRINRKILFLHLMNNELKYFSEDSFLFIFCNF
ncbi:hypothetical protein CBO05C_1397 [Clostridium botulinum B str. Osaka05]|uniref:Uncharacterized protein n=1 Tax=Clostridium botulinum B str. Osaka05 TaxID=1407017 RepID=A0A0S6U1H9_CLOBO|nr:hypothetical protein CBO05C_1397 [Clostridium botulinum B str. Osaka05]